MTEQHRQRKPEGLPAEWATAPLRGVSQVILGQSPPSSTYNEEGDGLPFFQGKAEFGDVYPTVKKWCSEPRKTAEEGDVLISVRAPVGPTNVCPENACIGRGLAAVRPLAGMESRFLLYLLRAFEDELAGRGTGTTFDAITGAQLRGLTVPLPPLNEQRRIVEKIEELFTRLDAGVEELREARRRLESYRQAVLRDAFTGKLTEQWREAHKGELEPAAALLDRVREEGEKRGSKGRSKRLPGLDTSELPEIPSEWEYAYLSEAGELNRGKSRHRPRNDPILFGGDYPFIQTGEVKAADLYITSYNEAYNETGLAQSKLWEPGTLCITIAANIAETAILAISACFPDSVVGFLPHESYCEVKFVHYFFSTIQRQLEAFAPATAQKNINLGTLRELPIPFADPMEQEQVVEEIERRFSLIDAAERTIGQSLKQADRLRQSILKRAFEGRLVPQDPKDEPAEKLLERIEAAKAEE